MPKSNANPQVDTWFDKDRPWQRELQALRRILLGCGLREELKWGKPCYTFLDRNVVILIPMKPHCVLTFFKGGQLKDTAGILVRPGEHTQDGRQMRFTSVREIADREAALKSCLRQAIEIEAAGEKAGAAPRPKKVPAFELPEELRARFAREPALKKAFEALTPGRQRAWVIYFSGAKQSETRAARIEKSKPLIMAGKGMRDDFVASRRTSRRS